MPRRGSSATASGYTVTRQVILPAGAAGSWFLIFKTDDSGTQPETAEENNWLAKPFKIESADLTVAITSSPASASAGQSVTVTWRVTNSGTGTATAGYWYDYVYLSGDTLLDSNDGYLGYFSRDNSGGLASGAFYNGTATFTLPADALGSQYLIVAADHYNYQGETNDGNNTAAAAITLNAPDLTVVTEGASAPTAPASAVLGETISVSWTVKNIGAFATTTYWYDRIYLSTDATLDEVDTLLAEIYIAAPNLAPTTGQYTRTQSIFLPESTAIGATVYLLFVADGTHHQGETSETNNAAARAIAIAAPDLTAGGVTAPATAVLGEAVSISWTVTAQGQAASANWYDYIYISSDNVWDAGDTQLLAFWSGDRTPLAAGQSYTETRQIVLPSSGHGDRWLFAVADGSRSQGEANEANNASAGFKITLSAPDLQVTRVTVPAGLVSSQEFDVSWAVSNLGNSPALTPWSDAVYLSSNATFEPGTDTLLQSFSAEGRVPLPAQGSYSAIRTVRLPSVAAANYYIIVVADSSGSQGESNEGNNVMSSTAVTVTAPDLEVVSVTAPATAAPGQTVTLSWTVRNAGTTVAAPGLWSDAVYLSSDATFNPAADLLAGSFTVFEFSPLAPGGEYTATRQVTIPGGAAIGTWRWIVVADHGNGQGETDETDNFAVSQTSLTLQVPDLTVASAAAPAQASVQQTITVSWTVNNIGAGAASAAWSDQVWLSFDTNLTGDDLLVGTFGTASVLPVAGGGSYTLTRTLTLPNAAAAAAYHYLLFVADGGNVQAEVNEGNNVGAAVAILITEPPDLNLATVSAPAAAAVGQTIDLAWTVGNIGASTAYADWYDRVYLSTDNVLNTDIDTLLLSERIEAQTPLAPGASYSAGRPVQLPGTGTGTRYLIFVVNGDGVQGETLATNNTKVSTLQISDPDLRVTETTAPAAVSWGQAITLSWKVENNGSGAAAGTWYDRVYLSSDQTWDGADILLLSAYAGAHSPLAAGGSYTVQTDVTLPSGLTGAGYLLFVTDAAASQAESNETNNSTARAVTFNAADLTVTGSAPAAAAWGERIDLAWTVTNSGTGPATAGWWDMVYLSTDNVYDSGDLLLASEYRTAGGGLAAATSYTVAKPAASVAAISQAIGTGSRFLLFRADTYGQQSEQNEANNTAAVPITIRAADLTVSVTSPASAAAGKAVTVEWTVTNGGQGRAVSLWYDVVFLSSDALLDSNDTVLKSLWHGTALDAGAAYTAGESVTLPGGLTGSWYLIVAADHYGYQPESNEANNDQAKALSLSAPDLSLGTVTAPATIANGQTLTVTWRTTNIGSAAADRPWWERAVLSKDAYLGNYDDIEVGSIYQSAALAAGASLDRTAAITAPWGVTGDYRLYIRIDAWSELAEASEANNAYDAALPIVYAAPPADLVVDAVTVPAAGSTGQPLSVSWRVTNNGTAATTGSAWSDILYISSNTVFGDADDRALGTFAHSGALGSKESYGAVEAVIVPADLLPLASSSGSYWIFVRTDVYSQILEPGAEENNTGRSAASVTVSQSPVPDLRVTSVSGTTPAVIGQGATVTWTVSNAGGAEAAFPWTDRLYLSADGNVAGATLLGTFTRSQNLAAGTAYTRTEAVALPAVADGAAYVWIVVTDTQSQVYERSGETNNTGSQTGIAVRHPDLRAQSIQATPASANSGSAVTISWTGRNAGTGATAAAWTDRVYLSNNNTLSVDDLLLGSLDHAGVVQASATYAASLAVTLPNGLSGSFYLIVRPDADNVVVEGAGLETDIGVSAAFPITLAPYADLEVSGVTAPEQIIGDPADLTVTWIVTNKGNGTGLIDAWTDAVILSRNTTLGDGDDLVMGRFAHQGLMPAQTFYSQSQTIQLPAAFEGRFTLFVVTDRDDAVYEHTGTGANSATPGHLVDIMPLPYADLVLQSVDAPAGLTTGTAFSLSWTVKNQGIGPTSTPEWFDQVWISSAADGSGATLLGSFSRVGNLAAGAAYTRTVEMTLPVDAAVTTQTTATRYLFVRTAPSGPYEFIYGTNNASTPAAKSVTYTVAPRADLEIVSVTAPASAADGAAIDVTWTVRNNAGTGATGSWTDGIYIAPNGDRNQAIRIGAFTVSQGLGAGYTYTRTENFRLPLHITGVYALYVKTDIYNQVLDPDRTNNDDVGPRGHGGAPEPPRSPGADPDHPGDREVGRGDRRGVDGRQPRERRHPDRRKPLVRRGLPFAGQQARRRRPAARVGSQRFGPRHRGAVPLGRPLPHPRRRPRGPCGSSRWPTPPAPWTSTPPRGTTSWRGS